MELDKLMQANLWQSLGKDFILYDPDYKQLMNQPFQIERKTIRFGKETIAVVSGPRRTGKTVWIKQCIDRLIREGTDPRSIYYLPCDQLTSGTARELDHVMSEVLERCTRFGECHLYLDEINFVKDWHIVLKGLQDSGRLSNAAVVVSGSVPFLIRKQSGPLAGRKTVDYIFRPLSFREFVRQIGKPTYAEQFIPDASLRASLIKLHNILDRDKNGNVEATLEDVPSFLRHIDTLEPFINVLNHLLRIYVMAGGFPVAINGVLKTGANTANDMESPAADFVKVILDDINKIGMSDSIAKQILSAVLKRSGSHYSYTALAKETEGGVSHPTVIEYIAMLSKSFILNTVYNYDFAKKAPRSMSDKKIYFLDPFLYHSVSSFMSGSGIKDIMDRAMSEDSTRATLYETMVCEHVILSSEIPFQRESDSLLWFHYDSNSRREIDFIYRTTTGRHIALEVTSRKSPSDRKMKILPHIDHHFLLTGGAVRTSGEVKQIPLVLFLAALTASKSNL